MFRIRDRATRHVHTTAATAEEVTGWTAGATLRILGIDTDVYVGESLLTAQERSRCCSENVATVIQLPVLATSIFIDADTGGIVSIIQVSDS